MPSVAQYLLNAIDRYADRTAVICGDERRTFTQLGDEVFRLANGMLASGLAKGDRVGVLYANSIDGLRVMWACYLTGIVPVTLNPRVSPAELEREISHSGAKGVFGQTMTPEQFTGGVPAAPPHVALESRDELHHGYGSGTTGVPKCIVETHGRWISIALSSQHEFEIGIEPDDVVLHIAPVTHASGTLVLPHVIRGAANCLLPTPDIVAFFETVQRERVTRTLLVPTLINAIVSHPRIDDYDLSSLRHIVYGSSPIAPDLLRRATERFGPIFEQYYGLAEYAPATILRASDHHKTGSAGRVVLDTELKFGDAGEVLLRGPGAFSGYWRDPELTAKTITEDGWVHTGDVGYLDEEGFLYLIDRTSNMIITGGFNVFPASIENALSDHPDVHECAVIGLPDDRWGEAVTAVVVTTGEPTQGELIDFLRGKVATYEVPKAVLFVEELPKSANGKILHRELRATFM